MCRGWRNADLFELASPLLHVTPAPVTFDLEMFLGSCCKVVLFARYSSESV